MSKDELTPTELARALGMDRREVISECMRLNVQIWSGLISKSAFVAALEARQAEHFSLIDSAGNLIDSFDSYDDATAALRGIIEADAENEDHVSLIAFDAAGNPVEPQQMRTSVPS